MTECIPHPDDPSLWLPVEEAIPDMWDRLSDAVARLEAHDNGIAALQESLASLTSRLDSFEAKASADTSALASKAAALRTDLDALKARVDAIPQTGPAFGVDVSGHQTTEQVKTAATDTANAFVIVKTSEGEGFQSPPRAEQVAAVRAASKLVGHYHFAWTQQDPAKEAANFLAASDIRVGDLVALDIEKGDDGATWATRLVYTLAWLDAVKAATGAKPLVYANWNWVKGLRTAATLEQWARLTAYPLWLAEWSNVPGQHSTVTSKDGTNQDSWPIHVHQYGVLDGVGGRLDRNWTRDIAALKALAATKAA